VGKGMAGLTAMWDMEKSASRFCRAFDEVRQFFRIRSTMKQKVSLAFQREAFCQRLDVLKTIFSVD
jgi:putative transposase